MRILRTFCAAAVILTISGAAASAATPKPTLEGRAVLPVETYALGPASGSFFAGQTINGISFPLTLQPVQGFSAILPGREPGEYLAMPDNGFGSKANSKDFLIRAYYIVPHFKTARGGSGTVEVRDFIRFRDPEGLIGFDIVNKGTSDRLLTGGDIDPESLQRGKNGDLWMGDEFGPWILHFSADGVLLDPPFELPDGLRSPNNPFLNGPPETATQPNSRGFEAMSITPDGKHLYAALEGATVADKTDSPKRRYIFEFSVQLKAFTGRQWQYRTEDASYSVADMWALDEHRMVVIERDGAPSPPLFRKVYVIDLRRVGSDRFVSKSEAVDLTKIPDPNLVSLPPIHPGDVGLGNPFRVMCESIEAIQVLDGERLLLGCDNNFPNTGRNPNLADDNEFIIVKVPGLKSVR